MRTISITTLLIFSFFYALAQSGDPRQNSKDLNEQLKKFNQFYHFLNYSYVDTINNSKLIEDAIKKVLSELDPHSSYVNAEDMKGVEESFGGSFSGIGVEFDVLSDTLIVVNALSGGPAESVGVMPNDRIVVIDGVDVVGIKRNDVSKYLRGVKGTTVDIEVLRRGEDQRLLFSIVRDDIPLNTVDGAYKISSKIGYVKINRFAATTNDELLAALESFGEFESLILDLRGNGGGFLEQAVLVSENFLEENLKIVSIEGREPLSKNIKSKKDGKYLTQNIIVLIDESSASASEIVAGTIQDWDRGVIVGRRSFGKGLVQRQFKLVDGSAVRVTIAKYHTPTGRVIQRPFTKGDSKAYYDALNKRFKKGYVDSVSNIDSLRYKTLRAKRDVYAGGGIFPDVYIDFDTTGHTIYWANLVRKGVINEFVISYMDSHRKELKNEYRSFKSYSRKFEVSDEMLEELMTLGETRGVKRDEKQMEISSSDIKSQLKAMLAFRLWSLNEYYKLRSLDDSVMIKALDILENWDDEDITKSISGF